MTFWNYILEHLFQILTLLGVGALFSAKAIDKYNERKAKKNHIKELEKAEEVANLKKLIQEELSPLQKELVEIKEEELKLKKSTTTLIQAHINKLYDEAQKNNKQAINDLLNMTNDPIYIDDNTEEIKEKVKSVRGYYAVGDRQLAPAKKSIKKK